MIEIGAYSSKGNADLVVELFKFAGYDVECVQQGDVYVVKSEYRMSDISSHTLARFFKSRRDEK